MADDWRNFNEGRRGISLSHLEDGESIIGVVDEPPYLKEQEIERNDGSTDTAETIYVPFVPTEVPDGFTDMNGDEIQLAEGADSVDEDSFGYHVMNSSTVFKKAMRDAFPEGVAVAGSHVEITANQSGDEFSRTYTVDW